MMQTWQREPGETPEAAKSKASSGRHKGVSKKEQKKRTAQRKGAKGKKKKKRRK